MKKNSAVLVPALMLASQSVPSGSCPRRPATAEASRAAPPNLGVKPPGNSSRNEKQCGSSATRWSAAGSGASSEMTTVGQFADPSPRAASTSPTSRVRPPSLLNTPPRGVRVPEIEEADDLPARVVRVAVELHPVAEQVAGVAEQLDVVVDLRRSPYLSGVVDVGVAGRDEGRRVAPLAAAAGGVGVAVREAEVGEAGSAERQAGVAGEGVAAAVARGVGPGAQLDAAAGPVVLEQEVQHAGDGVRAVLRGGAVPQHLHLPQGDRGDRGEVRPLGALLHAVGVVPGDDRSPVAALPVDQNQRMVRCEAAEVRRPDDGRGVAVLLRVHVEGRQHRPQLVGEVRAALPDDIGRRDGIDRHRRRGHRAGSRAAADDDDFLGERRRWSGGVRSLRPAGGGVLPGWVVLLGGPILPGWVARLGRGPLRGRQARLVRAGLSRLRARRLRAHGRFPCRERHTDRQQEENRYGPAGRGSTATGGRRHRIGSYARDRSWFLIGRSRTRIPVAA